MSSEHVPIREFQAAVVRNKGGPFAIEPVRIEEVRRDEVLVRIVATGMCHTDMVARDQVYPVPHPIVLGHEGAGVVVAVGAEVEKVVRGDHVVLTFLSCGHCRACLEGAPASCENFNDLNFSGHRRDGSHVLSDAAGQTLNDRFFGQSSFAAYVIANVRNVVKVRKDAPLEMLGPLGCGIQTGAGAVLAKLFEEAGLPPGVLNVVVGAGSEIGDYFVEHPTPRLISFTGSTEVGRGIGRIATSGTHIKRVALELGGNSPLVVLTDADIEQAAHAAVVGRFLHQGQICISTNRVIVDAGIHDPFVDALADRVRRLRVGNPNDAETVIGPVINEQQLKGLLEKIENVKRDGGRQVVGAKPTGNLLPPHLFTGVNPDWSIVHDESFGPLLPVIKARDESQALELANATEYGLSSAVFTRDFERGVRFARDIIAGKAGSRSRPGALDVSASLRRCGSR